MKCYRITTTGKRGGDKRTDYVNAPTLNDALFLASMDGSRTIVGTPKEYNRTTKRYQLCTVL